MEDPSERNITNIALPQEDSRMKAKECNCEKDICTLPKSSAVHAMHGSHAIRLPMQARPYGSTTASAAEAMRSSAYCGCISILVRHHVLCMRKVNLTCVQAVQDGCPCSCQSACGCSVFYTPPKGQPPPFHPCHAGELACQAVDNCGSLIAMHEDMEHMPHASIHAAN